ncbi:MAG: LamB/YcsF family protein [Actinomycetota bacterium]|nr:LamB/YcsF family protein [Actinomycetota bacterium]
MRIDLNADLGESPERWESGEDVELLATVTSANICCGAYAGGESLMRATCAAAVERGVAIGAQVGYPDRANFGRLFMDMPAEDLTDEIARQILLLDRIAQSVGGRVKYVKPHGALYNNIVIDDVQAEALVNALVGLTWTTPLLGLPGSVSLSIAGASGIPIVNEGFADRGYTPRGTLIPRTEPGALLDDPAAVSAQAVRLLHDGLDSICVHSDSPGALALARAVRASLEQEGADVKAFAT